MKKFIKLTIVCAFLFVFGALSVNAQTCTDPACPFNTDSVSMTGPVNMIYIGGYGYYSLPFVSGAKYVWSSGFLKLTTMTTPSIVEFSVPPDASGTTNSPAISFCYWEWDYIQEKYVKKCEEMEYQWWFPRDTIDVIECTVTYNGHEHYFWKKVFIWQYYWGW